MSSTWGGINAGSITGFDGSQPGSGSGGVTQGVESAVATQSTPPLYSPQNPLFWLGAGLLVAAGLFHVSFHAKGAAAGGASL